MANDTRGRFSVFTVNNTAKVEAGSMESDSTSTQGSIHSGSVRMHRGLGVQQLSASSDYLPPPRQFDLVDRIPSIELYNSAAHLSKSSLRPSLSDLHDYRNADAHVERDLEEDDPNKVMQIQGPKFGWIQGVLVRCFLCIIGVMVYLRLTWVTGQAGIGLATVIVLLSSLITTLTTISMCAICTNGEVKGGGTYFLLSRSLGPEIGGSIGIIFAFANAVAAAMYAVGFAETLRDTLKDYGIEFLDNYGSGANANRVLGISAILLLYAITQIGMAWEAYAQNFLLGTLLVSLVNYVVGTFIPSSPLKKARGFIGYSGKIFSENFVPAFRNGESFFTVFGVYFPAATGILAGANISGDLKNPSHDIPLGTLLAILLTTFIYGGWVWFSGSSVLRDASGSIEDYYTGNLTNCYIEGVKDTCQYGLMNYMQTCQLQSAFGPLTIAGIFAATLSSALASLVSAPKVFQALCNDRLFPYISIFGKGYGKHGEPRLGYLLALCICLLMLLIGELNVIAPIISNFFLATYGLINFATFDASLANSPGFRPSFRYYNKWVSLLGCLLCVASMFVINWITALATFVIIAAIYIYLLHRKPDVNWGSSSQAHTYRSALKAMLRLQQLDHHIKNYRPQVLCLTGDPRRRPAMVDFVANITRMRSLLMCGHVIIPPGDMNAAEYLAKVNKEMADWFVDNRVRAFYQPSINTDFRQGARDLIRSAGISNFKPNVLLIGFKTDWATCPRGQLMDYFNILHDAFDARLSVCILRSPEGLDVQDIFEHKVSSYSRLPTATNTPLSASTPNVSTNPENHSRHHGRVYPAVDSTLSLNSPNSTAKQGKRHKAPIMDLVRRARQNKVVSVASQFKQPIKNGRIDVYWLFDDGGLILLLAHLLTRPKSYLDGAKLRVFALAQNGISVAEEKTRVTDMLKKLRIVFSEVQVVTDFEKNPARDSMRQFTKSITPHKQHTRVGSNEPPEELSNGLTERDYISDVELQRLEAKTKQHLRLKEIFLENSKDTSLIISTLTIPRKGECSAPLYAAWLDHMTRGLPPVLLVRGNQESVLTFQM